METLILHTGLDGLNSRNSILLGEEGFIVGNPNNYEFSTSHRSFDKPAHFYNSEAKRIVKHINHLTSSGLFPKDHYDLTIEIEFVRLSPEVKAFISDRNFNIN